MTVLGISHVLSHLILLPNLYEVELLLAHFVYEETEAARCWIRVLNQVYLIPKHIFLNTIQF